MNTLKTELHTREETTDERTSELLSVLNKWPDEPPLKELATILELAKHAEELERELRMGKERGYTLASLLAPKYPTTGSELNSALSKLNHLLGRYRYSLKLEARAGRLERLLKPEMAHAKGRLAADAVSWIVDLARNRALSRLRRCRDCGKWIFAVRSHQSYCNDRCRRKFASTADDFKRKRREYMATYRAGLKEREMRQLGIVRRKRR
jgi:hypothetical protein